MPHTPRMLKRGPAGHPKLNIIIRLQMHVQAKQSRVRRVDNEAISVWDNIHQ